MPKPDPTATFKDAAEVAEKMEFAANRFRETDVLTGVSMRQVIPILDALVTLAREIEAIKSRLPPPHGSNGTTKRRKPE